MSRLFPLALFFAALGSVGFAQETDDDAKFVKFQQLLKSVQADPGGATDAQALELLDLAKQRNEFYAVSLAMKGFLSHHFEPQLPVVLAAAEIAQRAGDHRTAVARYKQYLRRAPDNATSAKAAGEMYLIMIDLLQTVDEVWQHMRENVGPHRKHDLARRFHHWFLTQAQHRKDYTALAGFLAAVLAENMPLEKERLYYWESLDWLMSQLTHAQRKHFESIQHVQKIIPLVRGDALRQKRYSFYLANLRFHATSTGQEQKRVDTMFGEMLAVARQYFDASVPTKHQLTTAIDIMRVLRGGHMLENAARFDKQQPQSHSLFVHMFGKLTDIERDELISWPEWKHFAVDDQLIALGESQPAYFLKSAKTPAISFAYHMKTPDQYRRQAKFLAGVPNAYTANINALAVSETDPVAVVDYWIKNEAWHVLVANSLQQQWVNYMWPAFSKFERKQPLPQDANTKATRRINEFDASQASSVFYTSMVGSHLAGLLSYEPEKLAAALNATAWLPYDEKQRAAIYDTNYTNFQTWAAAREKTLTGYAADETDAQQAAQAKADLPKHKALVAAIDAAFKAVRGLRSPNLNVAPSPHCRALAEARVAERAANWPQYNAACRKLYPLIKNYRQQKIPYGRLMLSYMLGGRGGAETIDMRLEIFKDHLARYRPGGDNYDVQYVAQRIFTGGTSWHLTGGPVKDRAQLEKVAAVVEEALWQYVSRNQLPPELFEWFLGTRSGTGWRAGKLGERIAEKIITAKLLHTQPYFYNSDVNGKRAYESAACSYMWLIKAHFGSLAEKYPVARYFDDMFVEEATRTGYLDSSYWSLGGLDEEKKIVACAAKLMAGFQTLPIGYGQTFGQPSTGNNPLHIGQIPHLPGSAAVVQAADRQRLAAAAPRWYTSAQLFDWQHRALAADPQQRDAMIAAVESRWNKTRFDIYAAGRSYFRTPASEMPEGNLPADVEARKEWRKTIFAKTASYVTKLKTLPRRYSPPYLYSIIKIDPDSITAEELDVLLSLFPGATPPQWPSGWGFDVVATCIQQGLINLGRGNELIPIAPEMWRITRNSTTVTNFVTNQVAFANMLTEQSELYGSELALAFASSGVEVMKSKLPVSDRIQMAALRNVNLSNVGGVIPVRKSDPRYPIFAAQTAYLTGRQEAAWKLYLGECKPKKLIDDAHRDLDPSFSIWLIDRCSETEDFDEATRIAQQMLVWFDSVPAGIDPEARARLMLSYATIAMEQKEFPRARAQFSRVVAAREFNGTRSQAEAELMIANVDRLQGRYDSAIEIIDKIIERDDPTIQAEAYLNLARVKFDQEELQEAKESLEKVFQREPEHPTGRILEGQVNLAMKKIEEAVELEIGSIALQRLIVPGKPLKVGLEDKNLSVVGKSTDVEIRAWTKSGDEEFFSLLPYGDSKTKFRGQIDTELAAINKGDGVLQVLGKDEVNYDFSERFKQRQKITFDKPLSLSVATDAALYASSGAIRTSEELEAQALEDLIRTRVGDPGPANITSQVIKPLSARRPENQVKPGNRVNLRVIDPDHSTTPGIDQLTMRLKAKSGDRIEKFTLTETSEYSGVFEGSVETRPGQPVAYASDSQEDRDPNFAISPKEYPTWVGLGDGIRPKHFSIDLNDNVSVDQMTVIADQPGNRLKKFTLEVSIDGKKFQTIGSWPQPFQPWDGSLRMQAVCAPSLDELPATLAALQTYLGTTYVTDNQTKARRKLDDMGWKFDDEQTSLFFPQLPTDPNRTQFDESQIYFAHLQGAIYQNVRRLRTIRLESKNADEGNRFYLSIDGKPSVTSGSFKGSLAKGVHTIDVYVAAKKGTKPDFELIWDTLEEPYEQVIPAEAFSLASYPQIRDAIYVPPAKIMGKLSNEPTAESAEPGDANVFSITFDPSTQARVVRLNITDFEVAAPAISKVFLTDRDGGQVLPTKKDFRDLWKNETLEIISGDTVTGTYLDQTVITRGNDVHERSLTATYANGSIRAAFAEYTLTGSGERTAHFIPMRRFKAGDVVHAIVTDPDLDVSKKLDTVKFTAKTYEGKPVTLTAVETGPHTGIFVGRLFPIEGEPKRESEIRITEDDEIRLSYLDSENISPGVPWRRTSSVEQVYWKEPEIRTFDVTTRAMTEEEIEAVSDNTASLSEEFVSKRRSITAVRPMQSNRAQPATQVIGLPLMVEVIHPFVCQSPISSIEVFAQTKLGRKFHGRDLKPDEFDIDVPGTIRLEVRPSGHAFGAAPRGYDKILVRTDPYAVTPLDDGRFTAHIPLVLGDVPPRSYATLDQDRIANLPDPLDARRLKIKGDDEIFIGFKYTDQEGEEQWLLQSAKLTSDAFFDTMDRRYQEPVTGLYVGQNAYFRVIHPSMNLTEAKDTVQVTLTTTSGKEKTIELLETYSNTGEFKGLVNLIYDDDSPLPTAPANAEPRDDTFLLPVTYGDRVNCKYIDTLTDKSFEYQIEVFKGSDGTVLPFTKRFNDAEIAVQTQFTIAESYFELAKRHRQLGQQDLARKEIAQGKKLLEEALRDYPDTKARVQADYLLANLSLEFAKDAKEDDTARKFYVEAVNRFSTIVASYPDSTYAPKCQYKKAQALEKMGDIDLACEEYVKLSYRYPDHELIAETIAALGTYFSRKGLEMKKQAEAAEDAVAAEKIILQSKEMFKTAAEVFSRLGDRFPDHTLSTITTVRSAQCYMRAEIWDDAINTFQRVLDDKTADKDLRAEAMYWCADCYMRQKESMSAYRVFKPLTWEYPESKWARYARGRLATDKSLGVIDAAGGENP